MRLYHGTSSRHLARILDRGLEPRGRRKGNWKAYPSRRDMVYLTDSYAPFFGNDFYIDIVEKCQPGYRKMVEEMFSNREGIEVVDL